MMRSSLSPKRLSARVPAKTRADHLWNCPFTRLTLWLFSRWLSIIARCQEFRMRV